MNETSLYSPDDERRIQEKMQQLEDCQGNYSLLDTQLLQKRLSWYRENRDRLNRTGTLVRQAREMVLINYMHLDSKKDVPIYYEDPTKITWRSFNFCPILVACQRLGLDTRVVCKQGAEKSVQILISQLNPSLVFSRNYDLLRPYGFYCEETIELREIS